MTTVSAHRLSAFLREFASWWDRDCDASPVDMKDQSRQFREAADALDQLTRPIDAKIATMIIDLRNAANEGVPWLGTAADLIERLASASAQTEAEKESWHILALRANERADRAEADATALRTALQDLHDWCPDYADDAVHKARLRARAILRADRDEAEKIVLHEQIVRTKRPFRGSRSIQSDSTYAIKDDNDV